MPCNLRVVSEGIGKDGHFLLERFIVHVCMLGIYILYCQGQKTAFI